MSLINWKLAFIAFLLVGVSMSGTCWKCSDIMGSQCDTFNSTDGPCKRENSACVRDPAQCGAKNSTNCNTQGPLGEIVCRFANNKCANFDALLECSEYTEQGECQVSKNSCQWWDTSKQCMASDQEKPCIEYSDTDCLMKKCQISEKKCVDFDNTKECSEYSNQPECKKTEKSCQWSSGKCNPPPTVNATTVSCETLTKANCNSQGHCYFTADKCTEFDGSAECSTYDSPTCPKDSDCIWDKSSSKCWDKLGQDEDCSSYKYASGCESSNSGCYWSGEGTAATCKKKSCAQFTTDKTCIVIALANYKATACKWMNDTKTCIDGVAADLPKDKCIDQAAARYVTWNDATCLECEGELPDYVKKMQKSQSNIIMVLFGLALVTLCL